ncbi:septum formation initiator family protein [Microbacterium luticocti]|uniref:septum formation initiator family protein n=1 Tax=Microbacterium luticocti TaxID=451764 RepID=UPI00040923E9|nr:septum formation initiator family protein [Microbacterium luticocti]
MARRPAPPSRPPKPGPGRAAASTDRAAAASTTGGRGRDATPAARRPVDVRGWLEASRISGFTVIMLGLVVLGVFVLVPTVGTYISQRQQIAALAQSVQVTKDEVADLQRQRARYKDPAYITAQARERLYYANPGEVIYLVDNDLADSDVPREKAPVSDKLQATQTDWMSQLVRSVAEAGLARSATAPSEDTSTRTPTPSRTPGPTATR